MFKISIIAFVLLLTFFLSDAKATTNWTEGDYVIPNDNWPGGNEILNTYNDVTLKIYVGGFVNKLNMYDNSELTMYKGSVDELNLYPNARASLLGGVIHYLWIDQTSSSFINLYAHDIFYFPSSGPTDGGSMMGYWNSNNASFNISFTGDSTQGEFTRSHIQIIPEPATFALISLGSLFALRKRIR